MLDSRKSVSLSGVLFSGPKQTSPDFIKIVRTRVKTPGQLLEVPEENVTESARLRMRPPGSSVSDHTQQRCFFYESLRLSDVHSR